jgi:ring-1,2-phenylacetyl-CoA epoxidase subunit PaaB
MSEIVSLDPRISRLHLPENNETPVSETETSFQLQVFIVFTMQKEGKPWESVGTIHAANPELALLFAKEQYTRRGNLFFALAVVEQASVTEFGTAGLQENMFHRAGELALPTGNPDDTLTNFAVFYQKKRGKSHFFLCNVNAVSVNEALVLTARNHFTDPCTCLWVFPEAKMVKTEPEEMDLWLNLPDKKYREVIMYKSLDRITAFKARQAQESKP